MFEVVDVTRWQVDEVDEQLGTKEKCWLSGETWLYKQVRTTPHGQPGEDWAEKLVEQLGLRLGLPMAEVELAVRDGNRGIISRSFVPRDAQLEHGNELLVRVDPDYDRELNRRNDRYTVAAVKTALADTLPPPAYMVEGMSAFDLWAGYLVLDAWVAGRDRHHENWGVVVSPGQRRVLAPSYDHGNALGFQESEERHRMLADEPEKLETWAGRGTSHHFAGGPKLVDLAHDALGLASAEVRATWLNRLRDVSEDEVEAIVREVPSSHMSVAARTFCRQLLLVNQRRICDVD